MDADTKLMGDQKQFETTRWNLVRASGDRESLNELISLYWKPLYFFVRQYGFDNECAKDIVQEFLVAAIQRRSFLKADPARGRFRTFLTASLRNFMRDRARSRSRRKRGGSRLLLSLDFGRGENDYVLQAARSETPEEVLNRAWARGLWDQSLAEAKAEPVQLKAFQLYLAGKSYRSIGTATGLSEMAVNSAVRRVKGELKRLITARLRNLVSGPEELRAELADFRRLLSDGPRQLPVAL
jgi:RNA polymerase sigma-70 factor (ECF subfamily)